MASLSRSGIAGFSLVMAASAVEAQSQRFDFTPGPDLAGWERPDRGSTYDASRGHGYEGPPIGGFSAFSVLLPEGDYKVLVTPRDASPLTVWAEARRLMVEKATGPQTFSVNVRRPDLAPLPAHAPGRDRVQLSPREAMAYNWDDRLTLFIDERVARIEIEPTTVRRLFLLGDSTVADQSDGDYASWGQMLPRFMSRDVSVANHAQSGETLKSFISAHRLDKALGEMRQGDLAMIQFGHNDAKVQWPLTYAEASTTFRAYLLVFIAEVQRRGALPVLVTSPHRRTFDASGRIRNSHGDYPDVVRAIASELNLPLIDLHVASATLYESLTPINASLAFAEAGQDATHHNAYGAYLLAWSVACALSEIPTTAALVDPDSPTLRHQNPPSFETFTLELVSGQAPHTPQGA